MVELGEGGGGGGGDGRRRRDRGRRGHGGGGGRVGGRAVAAAREVPERLTELAEACKIRLTAHNMR